MVKLRMVVSWKFSWLLVVGHFQVNLSISFYFFSFIFDPPLRRGRVKETSSAPDSRDRCGGVTRPSQS